MNEIKLLIAQERRRAARYTIRLLLDRGAPRALRARWIGLRAYHRAQMDKWRERL